MAEQSSSPLDQAHVAEATEWRVYATKLGLAAGCTLLGAAAGTLYGATSPTEVQIGPHVATAEVTFDNDLTLDAGVLGSLRLPDAGYSGFGGTITLGEIPASASTASMDDIGAVVGQYEQLFSNPQQTIDIIKSTVTERITNDATLGSGLGLGIAGFALLGSSQMSEQRRSAIREATRIPAGSRQIAQAATLSAVVLASCTYGTNQAEAVVTTPASSVFDGTPLEGVEVSGRLLQLAVTMVGPRVIAYVENVEQYYTTVEDNFMTAFEKTVLNDPAFNNSDRQWFQSLSDVHCNIGIDAVNNTIARMFGASFIINSGDVTMSGTAAEAECVNQSKGQNDIPYIFIRGNHDSLLTQQQAERSGMIVLDDTQTVDVGGLTIMGDGDPRESTFGTPIHYRGDETLQDQAERIRVAACDSDEQIDLLVVHAPSSAESAMEAGCATLSISGDTHHLSEPELANDSGSYVFTEGTSGGVAPGGVTVGTLRAPAVQTLFGYNPETGTVDGYYVITINPDQSVEITDYRPMPAAISAESPSIIASD